MDDQQPDIGGEAVQDAPQAADVAAVASDAVSDAAPVVAAATADAAPAAPAVPDVAPEIVAAAAAAPVVAAAVAPPPPVAPPVAPAPAPMAPPPAPAADPGWSQYVPTATAGAGPAPGFEYAGFWIRVLAYIIDGIILGIVTSILWFVVAMVAGGIGIGAVASSVDASGQITDEQAAIVGVGLVMAIMFLAIMSILVTFFYFTLLWVKRGATFGQSALGIRIARERDGGPLSWGQAIVRYIMMLVSFWIFYLGVIWVAFEPRKRGWHDMVAGTLAVRRV